MLIAWLAPASPRTRIGKASFSGKMVRESPDEAEALGQERHAMKFTRITVDPAQMGGVPCLRGLRIPVATVVSMTAEGMTREEILPHLSDLESDDIREALQFAAETLSSANYHW